jgi:hypothetical protein
LKRAFIEAWGNLVQLKTVRVSERVSVLMHQCIVSTDILEHFAMETEEIKRKILMEEFKIIIESNKMEIIQIIQILRIEDWLPKILFSIYNRGVVMLLIRVLDLWNNYGR